MAVYDQNNLPGTIMTGSGMYYPQANMGDVIPNFNQPLNEFAVNDSTFLDELQAQTGLLGSQIRQANPHATYTPTSERTIQGFSGSVAQNYFDPATNQFMMPGLGQSLHGGTQYTGTGTYTPGAFGEYYGNQLPTGGLITNPITGTPVGGGGGRDSGIGDSPYGYEKFGNTWYKINRITGEVTQEDPTVPGLIGMAIDMLPDQNIANTLDRIGRQYGSEVRDKVTRGLIAHPDFQPNPHTDVSFSSQPSALGYSLHSGQQYSGQDATTGGQDATTGGFDPSTDVGYDSDGDGIADRAVTYRDRETGEMKNVTWGEQDEAVGEQDADADPDGNGNGGGQNGGPGPGGPVGGPGHAGGHHF